MKFTHVLCFLVMLISLFGCQGSIVSQLIADSYPTAPRNYKSAGFSNTDEIKEYAQHSQYLAFKISAEDWKAFYNRFPEYWSDIQNSKRMAFMNDYSPGYTAYAFRWNLNNKINQWDQPTLTRLKSKKLIKGDDIYKIVYAIGLPERIMWDNDFDILLYVDDTAILLNDHKYSYLMACKDCNGWPTHLVRSENSFYKSSDKVLQILNLTRPIY